MSSRWLLVILLAFGFANCDRLDCWGGTLEGKPEPYKGKTDAVAPYMTDAKLSLGAGSCDSYTNYCGYFPLAKVVLHNPTSKEVTADVTCKYFVGDYPAHTSSRKSVHVAAKGSIWVELQGNISAEGGQESAIGVSCDAYWR